MVSNRMNERALRRSTAFVLAGLAALTATACDDTATSPEAVDQIYAESSVQEVWGLLPATVELESRALDALGANDVAGVSATLLLDAGELAAESDVAAVDGASVESGRLGEAADTLATLGLLSVFGDAAVDGWIADVETALARLEGGLGSSRSAEVRNRLRDARSAMTDALALRSRGDRAGALRRAAMAADALRWLDPEAKATAAVTAAFALLERATEVAGDDPEPPIVRALGAAGAFCSSSRVALQGGRWRVAIADAHACARISRAVLVRLSAGIEPGLLAERAEAAVAHAGAVLARVSEVAGPDPDPRVAALLDEAEGLLGRARVAFDAERYRAAIGLANASTAHSLRALRYLRADIPDPFEWRATAAVEVAIALSDRANSLIGEGTPEAIVEALARADARLDEAEAALEATRWYAAWSIAREVIVVFVRILVALA